MNKKLMICIVCLSLAGMFSSCSDDEDGCILASRKCDGDTLKVCINGAWHEEMKCTGAAPICDPDALACRPAEILCALGDTRCSAGNKLQICGEGGKWLDGIVCSDPTPFCGLKPDGRAGCISASGDCKPGEMRCEPGNVLALCAADGSWGQKVTCSGETPICGRTPDGVTACVKKHECTAGDTKCTSNNVLVTCGNDGFWDAGSACGGSTPICDRLENGKAGCISVPKTCQPGAAMCVTDRELAVCGNDGQWGPGTVCPEDRPICGRTSTGTAACKTRTELEYCQPGSTKCEGNSVVVCGSDKKWGAVVPCGIDKPLCSIGQDGRAVCVSDPDQCRTGDLQCGSGNRYRVCDNGSWQTKTLMPGTQCRGNSIVCEHEGGSCSSDNVYSLCSDGTIERENCSANTDGRTKCSDSGCIVPFEPCSHEWDYKCEGRKAYICMGTPLQWTSYMECLEEEICTADAERFYCTTLICNVNSDCKNPNLECSSGKCALINRNEQTAVVDAHNAFSVITKSKSLKYTEYPEYYNSFPWLSSTADLSSSYLKIDLDKLNLHWDGARVISILFIASTTGSRVSEVVIGLYRGDMALGNSRTTIMQNKEALIYDRFALPDGYAPGLNMRIAAVGDGDTEIGTGATLHVNYPVVFSIK